MPALHFAVLNEASEPEEPLGGHEMKRDSIPITTYNIYIYKYYIIYYLLYKYIYPFCSLLMLNDLLELEAP